MVQQHVPLAHSAILLRVCQRNQVDDTRKTLSYAVEELLKDIAAEKESWLATHQQLQQQCASSVGSPATPGMLSPPDSPLHNSEDATAAAIPAVLQHSTQQGIPADEATSTQWREPVIGVFVVHNKLKPKKADLPAAIMDSTYFTGGDIEDNWVRCRVAGSCVICDTMCRPANPTDTVCQNAITSLVCSFSSS